MIAFTVVMLDELVQGPFAGASAEFWDSTAMPYLLVPLAVAP